MSSDMRVSVSGFRTVSAIAETFTAYDIEVESPSRGAVWVVARRYNDFLALYDSMSPKFDLPEMPGKVFFGNNTVELCSERQRKFNAILNAIVANPVARGKRAFLDFLEWEVQIKRASMAPPSESDAGSADSGAAAAGGDSKGDEADAKRSAPSPAAPAPPAAATPSEAVSGSPAAGAAAEAAGAGAATSGSEVTATAAAGAGAGAEAAAPSPEPETAHTPDGAPSPPAVASAALATPDKAGPAASPATPTATKAATPTAASNKLELLMAIKELAKGFGAVKVPRKGAPVARWIWLDCPPGPAPSALTSAPSADWWRASRLCFDKSVTDSSSGSTASDITASAEKVAASPTKKALKHVPVREISAVREGYGADVAKLRSSASKKNLFAKEPSTNGPELFLTVVAADRSLDLKFDTRGQRDVALFRLQACVEAATAAAARK